MLTHLKVYLRKFVLVYVVHPDHLAEDLDSVEVVHSQDGAPLILIAQETKPLNQTTYKIKKTILIPLRLSTARMVLRWSS
jgi:hypothetical protein